MVSTEWIGVDAILAGANVKSGYLNAGGLVATCAVGNMSGK